MVFSEFNSDELEAAIEGGWVRRQTHPFFPFSILNYTSKTQSNWHWNSVTRACRGLILNHETGELVARPFPKFFNVGEKGAFQPKAHDLVIAYDKMDGSLGILYPVPGAFGYGIASRGSFTSDQARHGSFLWHTKYHTRFRPKDSLTYLFEIVYPSNRIVLDYGDTDDLVLLGAVHKETGEFYSPNMLNWPGPVSEHLFSGSYKNALVSLKDRPNKEGYVLWFPQHNERLKVKQEDYLALHRIVFGLTEVKVWEAMKLDNFYELLDTLPEEFKEWVWEVADRIFMDKLTLIGQVTKHYFALEELGLAKRHDRKGFALAIKDQPAWLTACLFAMLDGKNWSDIVYDQVKPSSDAVKPQEFLASGAGVTLVGGQRLVNVHSDSECQGRPCTIHNPSDHHMKEWSQNWRHDRGIMERVCPHGIGHPDPDDWVVRKFDYEGVHGCDGCCRQPLGPEEELPGMWEYSDFM